MHNPTDVISGALIGAGCVAVGYLSVRAGLAEAHDGRPDRMEPHPVQLQEAV
jgi:membrane-associated phospholipid phosphatase